MTRIIINNSSDASDLETLEMVKEVVLSGRVSNQGKQYCYLTVFQLASRDDKTRHYSVASFLNKKSDVFVILNYEGE